MDRQDTKTLDLDDLVFLLEKVGTPNAQGVAFTVLEALNAGEKGACSPLWFRVVGDVPLHARTHARR